MDKTLAVALGGLLAAGAAVGAYKTGVIGPQYAQVVRSTPVTVKEPVYADVVDAVPITQATESPQRVCGNQLVQVRQPERYGTRDGTLIGAVVGGLLGNQMGHGNGRTLATVGGAVAGGYVGRDIDRRHVGGRITTRSERVCHTETRMHEKTIGYEVRYDQNGVLKTMRVSKKPSDQVWLGDRSRIIGYDVDWRYRDKQGTVRLDHKPGERLPIRDGAIVAERNLAAN
jgi:uncharacterized protein YcfJ